MTFALGTFSLDTGPRFAGLAVDDRIVNLADLVRQQPRCDLRPGPAASVLTLLEDWDHNLPVLETLEVLVDKTTLPCYALSNLNVHPPVDLPRQIFCTGANYRKHVVDMTLDMRVGPEGVEGDALRRWAENMMDERGRTGEPYVFTKLPSAVTGAFDPIYLPSHVTKPDWEIELGVIIGRAGRNIARKDALSYVAGYCILNDITARDQIARTDYKMLGTDWLRSKCAPSFLPCGPYLVPAKFIPDPHKLHLSLQLNGGTMQDESTADMLFDVPRQIEYISRLAQLWPGDLIATGSPAGNGTHYNRFLRHGDVVDATITGLGQQRNRCRGG